MQQPCQRCGFISDRPSRFCRQCGASLFAENEATSATTRNYAPNQEPASYLDRPYISPYASGGAEQQVPNTTQFNRQPVGVDQSTPPRKRPSAWIWILAGLLGMILFAGAGLAVFFMSPRRARQTTPPIGEQFENDLKERLAREFEKVQTDLAQAGKDRDRGLKDAREILKNLPQILPTVTREMPKGLEKYRFPNADLDEVIDLFGNEIVKMSTDHDFEKVRDFYRKTIGQPTINEDADEEKLLYQIPGSPSITVGVSADKQDPGKTQILIWRSNLPRQKQNR